MEDYKFTCTSAVYNESEDFILASMHDGSDLIQGISVLVPGQADGDIVTHIKLDFSETVRRNEFQIYSISESHNGLYFLYGAFFSDEDNKEDLIGSPIVFVISQKIDSATTIEGLKAQKAIRYLYKIDFTAHAYDSLDEDTGNLPVMRTLSIQNSRDVEVFLLSVNHSTTPIVLKRNKDNFTVFKFDST